MALGMQVGLGPGHIVLDGDPTPLPRGAQPPRFRPPSFVAKRSFISATAEKLFSPARTCRKLTQLSRIEL